MNIAIAVAVALLVIVLPAILVGWLGTREPKRAGRVELPRFDLKIPPPKVKPPKGMGA